MVLNSGTRIGVYEITASLGASFMLFARYFPDYQPLHEDPRFAAIVAELDATPSSRARFGDAS